MARRVALVHSLLLLLSSAACGDHTPPAPAASAGPAAGTLDLRNATASVALIALGVATHDVVSVDGDAGPLAECARVTLVVPTPHAAEELVALLDDVLRPAGLHVDRSAGHVRMHRAPGVPPPPGCPPDVARHSPIPFASSDLFPPPPPLAPHAADPDETAILAGIHDDGDGHYTLTAAAAHGLATSQSVLMRAARVVPNVVGGQPDGLRLFGIHQASLLDALGLRNGDVVTEIDGHPLRTADDALEVYSALRGRSDVTVVVTRTGAPTTLHYRVTP